LQPLNEDPGVSAKRLSALAALFLSLRRHDPDQVRRVAAHPAASQPPVGAPLGCGNYLQSAALPSRLQAPGRILVSNNVAVVKFVETGHLVPGKAKPPSAVYWMVEHRVRIRLIA
jgi:hypothetical protein